MARNGDQGANGRRPGRAPHSILLVESSQAAEARLRVAIGLAFPEAAVHAARSLVHARAMFMSVCPDLIVIGLNAADTPLGAFLAEADHRGLSIQAVVVAGHRSDQRIQPALRSGAAGVLVKYDSLDAIGDQLRDALSAVLPIDERTCRRG